MRVTVQMLVMRVDGVIKHAEPCDYSRSDYMLLYPTSAMPDAKEFLQKASACCCNSDEALGKMVKEYNLDFTVRFDSSAVSFPCIGGITVGVEEREVEVT